MRDASCGEASAQCAAACAVSGGSAPASLVDGVDVGSGLAAGDPADRLRAAHSLIHRHQDEQDKVGQQDHRRDQQEAEEDQEGQGKR